MDKTHIKEKRFCLFCSTEHDADEPGSSSVYNAYACPACAEKMSEGIPLIGIQDSPAFDNEPPLSDILYPDGSKRRVYATGEWLVLSEESVRRLFAPEYAEQAIKCRKALITAPSMAYLKSIYEKTMMPAELSDEESAAHEELRGGTDS